MTKDFTFSRYMEIKTANGQIVNIECRSDDAEEVKKIFESIKRIDIPVTKELKNVCHGGYGCYTRFDIEQKKYAGGGCGYIECIKINNPPENRNGNIIHNYDSGHSIFYEFDTIENAINCWENAWSKYADEYIPLSKGFIRKVSCGWFLPWFYAIANQALYGDFVFPERVGIDHPIYRPFNKFLVEKEVYNYDTEEYEKKYDVKTCIGYSENKVRYEYDKDYINYTIYWDDGTSWSNSSLKDAPQLLDKDRYKIILKPKLCGYMEKKKYDKI